MFWIVLIVLIICAILGLAVGAAYVTYACFIAVCSLSGYAAVAVFVVGVAALYFAIWLTRLVACVVIEWYKGGNDNEIL